jgi:hypothetical protein
MFYYTSFLNISSKIHNSCLTNVLFELGGDFILLKFPLIYHGGLWWKERNNLDYTFKKIEIKIHWYLTYKQDIWGAGMWLRVVAHLPSLWLSTTKKKFFFKFIGLRCSDEVSFSSLFLSFPRWNCTS